MTDRAVPAGYEWPGADALQTSRPQYWLSEQAGWSGATPLFMVQYAEPGKQGILAERCYRWAGVQIVDALRAAVASR